MQVEIRIRFQDSYSRFVSGHAFRHAVSASSIAPSGAAILDYHDPPPLDCRRSLRKIAPPWSGSMRTIWYACCELAWGRISISPPAQAVRRGRITSVGDARVEFDLGEEISAAASPEITLVLAVFKFDRMEWAIEKCTELGVSRIVPVIARRTDSHLAAASVKRVERWQRIARQAAEQSRRAVAAGDRCAGQVCRSIECFRQLCELFWLNRKNKLCCRDVVKPDAAAMGSFWPLVPKAAGPTAN